MPGWLTKAGKIFGTQAPRPPQPFRLTCSCGQRIEGTRTVNQQILVCQNCGEQLFVLPEDVYPPLKPRRQSRKKRRRRRKLWQVRLAKPETAEKPPAQQERAADQAPAILVKRPRRALVTPFRVVVLMIVSVVVATGYWRWRAWSLEEARVAFDQARREGEAALSRGDFAAAAAQFQLACESLNVLGRDDEEARRVRQMRNESLAASHLATKPILAILQEANQTFTEAESDAEQRQAERLALALYEGQWIVMEARIAPSSGKAVRQAAEWEIDFPVVIDGTPVVIDADLAAFDKLPSTEQPRKAIFAARLQACRFSTTPDRRLVLDLDEESAFLWSSYKTYQALGFAPLDSEEQASVRRVLAEQSRLLGVDVRE